MMGGQFDVSANNGEVGFSWREGDDMCGIRMTPEEAEQLARALLFKAEQAKRQREFMEHFNVI